MIVFCSVEFHLFVTLKNDDEREGENCVEDDKREEEKREGEKRDDLMMRDDVLESIGRECARIYIIEIIYIIFE